jgi:anti-sigma factor RsiW
VTCQELADFIADYLSDDLPARTREAFDHHLSRCPNCVRYVRAYQESVRLGQHAFDDVDTAVPSSVPEELVQAILRARSGSGGPS